MAVDKVTIQGLEEAKRAFRHVPKSTRDAFNEVAIRPTASDIVRNAQSNLRVGHGFRTGALRESLGYTMNRNGTARIGIRLGHERIQPGTHGSALTSAGASMHRPTKIGHLVEFGHGGPMPALPKPFLMPAVRAEEAHFLTRCRKAGQEMERDMSRIGGSTL